MLKKYPLFNLVFAAIFIGQMFIEIEPDTAETLFGKGKFFIKPLITISLIIFYGYQSQLKGRFATRVCLGLLCSLTGDILLMLASPNNSYFIGGLLAFLLAHLFYSAAFYLDYKWNPTIEKVATRIALVIFGSFCLGFYFFLRPYLGGLKIPVMIYAFVISLMAIMAVNRRGRVGGISYKFVLAGAILFLVSDSILAYNKFVNPFMGAGMAIMGTYMLAQYLITYGALQRKLKKSAAIVPIVD